MEKKSTISSFEKMKIAALTGVVLLVIFLRLNYFLQRLLPELRNEYENSCSIRSSSDSKMCLLLMHPFALSITMAFIWGKTKGIIEHKMGNAKGLLFGVLFWTISLPLLLLSYTLLPFTLTMFIAMAFIGLIQMTTAGFIFSKTI